MTDIRDIRRLFDIRVIVGMAGTAKKVIVCPLPMHPHSTHSPSFSVFTSQKGVQLWKCHGACGLQGDVLDLIGFSKIPGYDAHNGDHVRQAMTLLTTIHEIHPPKKEKKVLPLSNDVYRRYLPAGNEVMTYGAKRGLTSETLEYFAVGQFDTPTTHWMTIPSFDGSRLVTLKMRNVNSTGPKDRYQNFPGSQTSLFNVNQVRNERGRVLIVKGEIVVMLLKQHGFLATAPTTGENNTEENWYKDLMFCEKRVVVGDNDPNPKVREKMVAFTKTRADVLRAELQFPPEKYKDLDQWILAEPGIALPIIQGWLK